MDGFGDEQHTKDWSFDGVYTRYHNHSYTNGDRWSSTNTSEFSPINRPRLIKIVTFWLTLLLLGLICVSIYLANIRETKTRYYISQGKLAILQEFTTALGNKDSMEYKSLTANFCNQMDKTFRKSRSYTSSYRMCVVTNLRPGSVIVTFTLYFDATVDVSDNAVLTAINASIQQVDSKQMLGNYPIDINELSVTTTLTLYKQDPLTFVEPNSDFIIPPTTKQTTTSTAVTSTSAIPATITTALPPVDTSETTSTTTSSIETTKVTIVIPTTETTKSTTTMPKTTTAETTTKSHTEPSTSRNTISLTSTTEPKSTPLPSTVTTTIQMTTATEGTTSSQTSPTTTITSSSLAPTVTTKPTTTIGLSTTNQHTKTTTFVPTTTTETTSTTSPPSSTTKETTTLPFSSSTETKTTSTLSLITTVATTSLSPTTTEAKTTTTFSPSTTAKQTTSTMTPTLTSEVTITATSSPVVTSQESREELTTKSPAKPTETTVSATFTTTKAATTISSNITTNTSTTSPVNETTGAWTTLPPTKTAEAEMSTTLPTTMTTKVVTSISCTIAGNKTTLSFQETTGTTMTMSSPKTTEGLTTIPTGKTAETTMSNTLLTTKEDATISTKTTSNISTTLPVTTEGLTSIPSTKTTEAEVSTTLPTTMATRVVTGMSSTITGNKTTLSFKETTEKTTITMSSLETTEGVTTILTGKTAETTVSNTLAITNEDTTISTNTTSNTPTTLPVKETTESLTTIPQTKTTEAEVSTTLPITESTIVATSMSPTITGNSTTTFPLIETTGTSTSSTTLMSTESRETSTMSEIITTLQSVSTSTNTDITVESTFTTFKQTSVSVENNTLSTNDTTLPPDNSAESSPDSTTTVETSSKTNDTTLPPDNSTESSPDSTTTVETSLSTNDTTLPPDNSTESSPDSTTTVETSSIISHTVSNNATAEPTVLPTSDISTLISTEETTLTNTTREDMTEATATRTTNEDTTGEVTTEATTDSTTTAAVTNSIREDITTALVTNTTKEVTTELTITNTTSDYTTQVTVNTTREYTTELMVTNTTREVTTEPTFTNTTREDTTEPTFTNTTREVTTEPTFTNTTREVTTEPTFTNTTSEDTTEPTFTNTTREVTTDTTVVDTSEYTSGTSTIATTMSPFTADLNFPSKKILAREDTTLECVIQVTDQWEKVTINQETENDYIFLAEFYNNGSVLSHVTSEFLSVVFKQSNETIETIIHINIQNISSCPSLLYFACGITMEDTFKSVITKTSTLSITAPLHNVTLDMATVYYSGERLELICRTITDFEYGEVALEVRSLNGLVYREPAPRTKYASTRNIDCSVEFEWRFRSSITLNSSMNGSTVRCIASNRLLNTSVSTSQLITVLVSEVSFSQYYVSGSVGKQVTIECKTNTLSSDIDKMAVYKTFNGTNETIALYSNGNTNSSSDVIVTFLDGVLTLTLSSLKCSDEGLYICVVATGSSEVASPLFLTLQPTVLAGSTVVSMSLNIDTVEHSYRHTSEHSCFGEIGYPDANGYLSLTATHPTSGKTVVYNEEDVTDAMKVKSSVGISIYDYGVILADDFGILVREDRKVQKNCSTIHQLRFFLNVSREWSRGSFRCEIRTKEGRIPSSVKEELFYVIPSDVCDNHNKTGTFYLDHEIPDNCNTYIQCSQQPPFGEKCPNPTHCMDVQLGYCDDCNRATCREIRTTTETPTTEAVQGNGYLECNSSYVYEGESANIGCNLNTTSFVSINVTRLNSTIASILADGSVIVYPEYQGKLTAILSLASLRLSITLFSVTCSDSDTYTSKMYLRSGNVPFTTFKVVMKVKPENPSLTLHHNLMDGQNMKSHSCTGYVGNPPGFLEIQIKRSSYSNFTKYSTPLQRISSSLVDAGNCSFRQTLNFSIDLTSDSWSNVTMRCVAINQMSLEATDVVPSSFLFSVTSITRDFCKNKTADYFDYHPMGCPFYVRCYKGTPNSHECQKDLCINPTEKACV